MRRYEKLVVLGIIDFTYLIIMVHRFSVVSFFPDFMSKFDAGYGEVGLLLSTFLLGYAIFQIPMGIMADRYGRKMSACFGLFLISMFAYFFSNALNLYHAMTFRFLMGVGSAAVYTSCFGLIAEVIGRNERGAAYGLYEASAGIGMTTAIFGLPLLSKFWEIDTVFTFTSFLSLVMLFLFPLIPKSRGNSKNRFLLRDVKQVVLSLKFWHLCSLGIIGLFYIYGVLTWLPTYLNIELGYSSVQAGGVTALITVFLVLTSPLAGKMSDIIGKRAVVTALGSFIMTGAFLMLLFFHDIYYLLAAAGIVGIAIAFTMPPYLSLSTELYSEEIISTVIGILLMFSQISSGLSSYILGYIVDISNEFFLVWLIGLFLTLIRGILALLLKEI